jgi:hypothetical protein
VRPLTFHVLRLIFYYFAGMKRNRFFFFFLLFFGTMLLSNCKPKESTTEPSSDIDAARNFIRAALDGKFDIANNWMLLDSSNTQFLSNAQRIYNNMPPDTINAYRTATIRVHNINKLNDSTTMIIYSNSYRDDHDTLRVIKKGDKWLVDLKYLFIHDEEMPAPPIIKDSIK